MSRCVLDKNHRQGINGNDQITKILQIKTLTSITYHEPFLKEIFLKQIIPKFQIPILFLDFDLMYSGYIESQIMQQPQNLTLLQPEKNNLHELLTINLSRLSKEKSLVIIDSINGFFNSLESESDVGRLVNSYILLVVSIASMSKSYVLLFSHTKKKEKNWFLTITSRQLVEAPETTKIHLDRHDSTIRMIIFDEQGSEINSCVIPMKSELI
jgi:hypothetical protein